MFSLRTDPWLWHSAGEPFWGSEIYIWPKICKAPTHTHTINFKAQFRCCHLRAKNKNSVGILSNLGIESSGGSCQLTLSGCRFGILLNKAVLHAILHPKNDTIHAMIWHNTSIHSRFFAFPAFECLNKSILGLGGLIAVRGCDFRSLTLTVIFHGLEWHLQWEPWMLSSAWPKRSSFLRPRTLYRFCSGFRFMDVTMIQREWEWLQR